LSAIGNDNRKSVLFEPDANCGANQRIVIDDENAIHSSPTPRTFATDPTSFRRCVSLQISSFGSE
jgi:hypothetical protein